MYLSIQAGEDLMSSIRVPLMLSMMIAVVLAGCSSGGGSGDNDNEGGTSTVFVSENPNLNISVQQVKISSDLRPRVEFILYDDADNIIFLDEIIHVEFLLAVLERVAVGVPFEYRSYSAEIEDPDGVPDSGDEATQAAYDPAGMDGLTQSDDGVFTFKFSTPLPEDYDRSATHQLGAEIVRFSDADQQTYVANLVMPFRPDGSTSLAKREIVSSTACNTCHTQLSVNDGLRTEVQLCILCHTSQTTDAETGNSLHFTEMMHKIHQGSRLQSFQIDNEPYQIHGTNNILADYSTVNYPQDTRNCVSCHTDASQADFYKIAPTIQGCQSCHDRVWYGEPSIKPPSFSLHPGGIQTNSSQCVLCHSPEGNGLAPVDFVHTFPADTFTAPGLALAVTGIDTTPGVTGSLLEINFTAQDKNGDPIADLAILDQVAATVAWTVIEYQSTIKEVISSAVDPPKGILTNFGDGSYSYTFNTELPATPENTFVATLEGRRSFFHRNELFDQGAAKSDPIVFSTNNTTPSSRRSIVLDQKCIVCHLELRAHEEQSIGINNCILCHNPNATDELGRPLDQFPPVSINFKEMIHRIHTGDDRASPYSIFDSSGTEHDFSTVRFPGDLRDCAMCHVEGSTNLPLLEEALSTIITEDDGNTVVSETFPMTAACISCHSTDSSLQHAQFHTDFNARIENCADCHGENSGLSVTNVHAFDYVSSN